jgi:hypothetical protein
MPGFGKDLNPNNMLCKQALDANVLTGNNEHGLQVLRMPAATHQVLDNEQGASAQLR